MTWKLKFQKVKLSVSFLTSFNIMYYFNFFLSLVVTKFTATENNLGLLIVLLPSFFGVLGIYGCAFCLVKAVLEYRALYMTMAYFKLD